MIPVFMRNYDRVTVKGKTLFRPTINVKARDLSKLFGLHRYCETIEEANSYSARVIERYKRMPKCEGEQ